MIRALAAGLALAAALAAGCGAAPGSSSTARLPAATVPTPAVRFTVSGVIPASQYGSVVIRYGTDSDSHAVTLASLDGTLAYSEPYDSQAAFYMVSAGWSMPGRATVTITAGGTVVASGHASASGGDSGSEARASAVPPGSSPDGRWHQQQ